MSSFLTKTSQILTPTTWIMEHEKTFMSLSYLVSVWFWHSVITMGWLGSLFFGLFTIHLAGMAMLIPIGILSSIKVLIDECQLTQKIHR